MRWLLAASLTDQLVILLVGFGLTTLVGGFLGARFQRRTWDHQNQRTLAEADRSHATQTCRELSQLMDKRLYRMLLVRWAVYSDKPDATRIEAQMEGYRAVLLEWNDNLMRNLAAAEIEFGSNVRNRLESDVYERFKTTGRMLEALHAGNVVPRAGGETYVRGNREGRPCAGIAALAHLSAQRTHAHADSRRESGRNAPVERA